MWEERGCRRLRWETEIEGKRCDDGDGERIPVVDPEEKGKSRVQIKALGSAH